MFKRRIRNAGKIAAVASFAVLAAGCEKEYGYTRDGQDIIREGPITIASSKPKETKADKKKEKAKEEEKKKAEEKKE